jgi:hypothetical protein
VSVDGNVGANSVMRLVEAHDVIITSPRILSSAKAFLSVEGASAGIHVEGGDLSKASSPLAAGTVSGAVNLRN